MENNLSFKDKLLFFKQRDENNKNINRNISEAIKNEPPSVNPENNADNNHLHRFYKDNEDFINKIRNSIGNRNNNMSNHSYNNQKKKDDKENNPNNITNSLENNNNNNLNSQNNFQSKENSTIETIINNEEKEKNINNQEKKINIIEKEMNNEIKEKINYENNDNIITNASPIKLNSEIPKDKITNNKLNDNKNVNNKKYNINEQDIIKMNNEKEYEKIIKNEPLKLFEIITEKTLKNWIKKLKENICDEDEEVVKINSDNKTEKVNIKNQEQIEKDVYRTRLRESQLISSFTDYLEFMLIYYCKDNNNIIYKQGLNELLAPFILLKYKLKNILFSEIYDLYKYFIKKYFTNYYNESGLYSLNSSLSILHLLVKYHIPLIYNLLDHSNIMPQMYATNWMLSFISNKLKLDILYRLWDYIIDINDNLFIFYIVVALLKCNSDKLTGCDLLEIPSIISRLTINTQNELNLVIKEALIIRSTTPYSFRILANKLDIFKIGCSSQDLQNAYNKYKPNTLLCLPTFPSEILYLTYSNLIKCPDSLCKNSKNKLLFRLNNPNNTNFNIDDCENGNQGNHICELCNMKINKKNKCIIIDLRIHSQSIIKNDDKDKKDQMKANSFLPFTVKVDENELHDDIFVNNILEKFKKKKNKYHFIFLSTYTYYFEQYEGYFYTDINSHRNSSKKMMMNIETKAEKKLDFSKIDGITDINKRYRLKEYDTLKKSITNLLQGNFPYISFVYGGYNALHNYSFQYDDIPLLNHRIKNCFFCYKLISSGKLTKDGKLVLDKVYEAAQNQNKLTKSTNNEYADEYSSYNIAKYKNDNIIFLDAENMLANKEKKINDDDCNYKNEKKKILHEILDGKIYFVTLTNCVINLKCEINLGKLVKFNDVSYIEKDSTIVELVVLYNKNEIVLYQKHPQNENELNRLAFFYINSIKQIELMFDNEHYAMIKYYDGKKENCNNNKTENNVNSLIIDFLYERNVNIFMMNIKSFIISS